MSGGSARVFRTVPGMRDVLPPESARWEALIATFTEGAERAGYRLLLTPLVEEWDLFDRGIGEGTDVVGKEMYELIDRGGRRLALRPEGTAQVARAYIQHRPPVPWKVWYWGANFRYERPQAGRYRQFFQLDAEAVGSEDPDLDVEVIALADRFYRRLGLRRLRLALNTLGDGNCRPQYREALISFLSTRADLLCGEHRERYRDNPLRVLDCKRPECRAATEGAPRQVDQLCEPCKEHWERVQAGLSALDIGVDIDARLVRGLDYYTRTTFEFVAEALGTAQDSIGGGGRYDGLIEVLGGPPTPAIGFALGIDRTLLACDAEGVFSEPTPGLDAFVVDLVGGEAAVSLTDELRSAGVSADRAFGGRSATAQMRAANRSGAAVALIVGKEEHEQQTVTVKPLRGGGPQETVPRAEVLTKVGEILSRATHER
ncbi:MAG: histidine--tRNA ligase [Acidimicrobiales bacterium]|nr:histidine--tRNA ligase [Acidimicrobiales bacterium]